MGILIPYVDPDRDLLHLIQDPDELAGYEPGNRSI